MWYYLWQKNTRSWTRWGETSAPFFVLPGETAFSSERQLPETWKKFTPDQIAGLERIGGEPWPPAPKESADGQTTPGPHHP